MRSEIQEDTDLPTTEQPPRTTNRVDVWNPMVKLSNEHPDEDVRAAARMLLGQYNTAGGRRIKPELESMLQRYGY